MNKKLNPVTRYLSQLHWRIFLSQSNKLSDQLEDIRKDNEVLSFTSNFFFRGETFISDNKHTVLPLNPSLRDRMISYNTARKALERNKKIVSTYFARLSSNVTDIDDIYYLVPPCVQTTLENPNIPEPSYVGEILDGSHKDAFDAMNKQALYKIIK